MLISSKKSWCQQSSSDVSYDLYVFWIFFRSGITVPSIITVRYLWHIREGWSFCPPPPTPPPPPLHPWEAPKRPERVKVVADGGEFTKNNDRKKKSKVLQAYRCPLCDKCYKPDWGKYNLSCDYIFFVGR